MVQCEDPLYVVDQQHQRRRGVAAQRAPQGQCRPQPHSEEGRQDGETHLQSDSHHHNLCLANPFNWTQEEIYVSINVILFCLSPDSN